MENEKKKKTKVTKRIEKTNEDDETNNSLLTDSLPDNDKKNKISVSSIKDDVRTSEKTKNYYQNIREKLYRKREQFRQYSIDINFTNLKKRLKEEYDIDPNERTLSSVFNPEHNSPLNMALVVAVCNIFDFNLNEIIQYDDHIEKLCEIPIKESSVLRRIRGENRDVYETIENKNISFLNNPLYYGTYHCYYFNHKKIDIDMACGKNQPMVNYIKDSTLEIFPQNGETMAVFTEVATTAKIPFKYKGRVITLNNIDKAYIFLAEEQGRGYKWLIFNHSPFKKRNLHYKEIACLTHTNNSTSCPIFEKMVLTREKIDLGEIYNEDIMRGILTFNTSEILINQETANKFTNAYPELKNIFDDFEPYCKVSSYDILFNNKLKWDYNKKIEALLMLMKSSTNNVQVVVEQLENIHSFFIEFQEKNKVKETIDYNEDEEDEN